MIFIIVVIWILIVVAFCLSDITGFPTDKWTPLVACLSLLANSSKARSCQQQIAWTLADTHHAHKTNLAIITHNTIRFAWLICRNWSLAVIFVRWRWIILSCCLVCRADEARRADQCNVRWENDQRSQSRCARHVVSANYVGIPYSQIQGRYNETLQTIIYLYLYLPHWAAI